MTRPRPARVPASTYRLQVTPGQDLFRCAELLDHLRALGADWVYLSPVLASEPGSDHGYDVVAHDHVDEERGGAAGLAALSARARELGLGVLVDVVPNHVGVATPAEDPWWWEVLRDGRGAEHAAAFDVDWDAGGQRLRVPVVGEGDLLPGGRVGHLSLATGERGLELRYWDHAFPVAPGTAQGPDGGVHDDPDAVHARQHYELVDWRRADDALNYRRFFAVNTLAAVRVEEPEVFAATHVEIGRWFAEDLVDGLRVDHPDGLRDPRRYLDDLERLTGGAYVLVEKVLEPGEELPTTWACEGTTGYDVLGLLDRVLVDPAAQPALDRLEGRLRGEPAWADAWAATWLELVHDRKRAVADGALGSEVARIVRDLRRHLPSLPAHRAEDAVAEVLACFEVYRSYLAGDDHEGVGHLDAALAAARSRRPDLDDVLDVLDPWLHDGHLAATRRLQQTSGMVMAKGVEDCAFYRVSRLTSLTEVGADPATFAVAPDAFHAAMADRLARWPHAMTTTSTHDTKRGEDTRARITALAELPEEWEAALDRLHALAPLPDRGFASLLWQAAVGARPVGRERLHAYAEKAMREAGERTAWTAVDEAFESAVHGAVDAAYDDERVRSELDRVADLVAAPGLANALALKLLALAVPGVPDVYQGSEAEERSLVDPDNRRPVDWSERAALLERLDAGEAPRADGDGRLAKAAVVRAALRLRRDRPELWGSYAPLAVRGEAAEHALALDRGGAVAVATRLPLGLAALGGWGGTTLDLPAGRWTETITGRSVTSDGSVRLADLLADLPVALLAPEEDD